MGRNRKRAKKAQQKAENPLEEALKSQRQLASLRESRSDQSQPHKSHEKKTTTSPKKSHTKTEKQSKKLDKPTPKQAPTSSKKPSKFEKNKTKLTPAQQKKPPQEFTQKKPSTQKSLSPPTTAREAKPCQSCDTGNGLEAATRSIRAMTSCPPSYSSSSSDSESENGLEADNRMIKPMTSSAHLPTFSREDESEKTPKKSNSKAKHQTNKLDKPTPKQAPTSSKKPSKFEKNKTKLTLAQQKKPPQEFTQKKPSTQKSLSPPTTAREAKSRQSCDTGNGLEAATRSISTMPSCPPSNSFSSSDSESENGLEAAARMINSLTSSAHPPTFSIEDDSNSASGVEAAARSIQAAFSTSHNSISIPKQRQRLAARDIERHEILLEQFSINLLDRAVEERWSALEMGRLVRLIAFDMTDALSNHFKLVHFLKEICPEFVNIEFLEGLKIKFRTKHLLELFRAATSDLARLSKKIADAVDCEYLDLKEAELQHALVEIFQLNKTSVSAVQDYLFPIFENASSLRPCFEILEICCEALYAKQQEALVQSFVTTEFAQDLRGNLRQLAQQYFPRLKLKFLTTANGGFTEAEVDEDGNLKGFIVDDVDICHQPRRKSTEISSVFVSDEAEEESETDESDSEDEEQEEADVHQDSEEIDVEYFNPNEKIRTLDSESSSSEEEEQPYKKKQRLIHVKESLSSGVDHVVPFPDESKDSSRVLFDDEEDEEIARKPRRRLRK